MSFTIDQQVVFTGPNYVGYVVMDGVVVKVPKRGWMYHIASERLTFPDAPHIHGYMLREIPPPLPGSHPLMIDEDWLRPLTRAEVNISFIAGAPPETDRLDNRAHSRALKPKG